MNSMEYGAQYLGLLNQFLCLNLNSLCFIVNTPPPSSRSQITYPEFAEYLGDLLGVGDELDPSTLQCQHELIHKNAIHNL